MTGRSPAWAILAAASIFAAGCVSERDGSTATADGGAEIGIPTAIGNRFDGAPPSSFGLGRPATEAEIRAIDVDIMPDGRGLPPGDGSVDEGRTVYQARCAACHGEELEGTGAGSRLAVDPEYPGFPDADSPGSSIAIGNYWPHATTVFDYVRRAMPFDRPGSLSDEEVYAVTAYLLFRNGVLEEDANLDAESLAAVQMPARDRFVADDRLETAEVR